MKGVLRGSEEHPTCLLDSPCRDFEGRVRACFGAPPCPDPRHPPASGANPPGARPTPPQDIPRVSNWILEASGTL